MILKEKLFGGVGCGVTCYPDFSFSAKTLRKWLGAGGLAHGVFSLALTGNHCNWFSPTGANGGEVGNERNVKLLSCKYGFYPPER